MAAAAAGGDNGPTILTRARCGETIPLRLADEVVLSLAETPGTGYRWTFTADGIDIGDDNYVGAPNGAVGGGGQRRLRLTANRIGDAVVTASLQRSWEGPTKAVDRCEFRFTVS